MLINESINAKKLHKNRQFSYDRISEYRKQFINDEIGLFYDKYLLKRNCPVCGSDSYQEVFQKAGGITVKCKDCTMIYLNPSFSEESLGEYYKNLNTGQATITQNESEFYREIYSLGLDLIEKQIKPGKILDIGCSSGFFLDMAKQRNWITTGIELGLEEADLAKSKGHIVFTEPIQKVLTGNSFDVITMWDVLEHILDGKEFLEILKIKLSKNGIIFFQIPNSDSLAARILQEKCNMHDGLEHVNLYNPKTINMLVESAGFQILQMNSVISELSVINNYLHYESPYFGNMNLETDKFSILNEKQIHSELLGYKLQIAIQRK